MNKRTITREWWNTRASKPVAVGMLLLHMLAAAAVFPAFFSWSGVFCFVLLYWVSGGLGITLCYHRLLTHRSFKTPQWVRALLTSFGCLAWQGSPLVWVGTHRFHHKHSDTELDPHTPLHGFSWAHMLWVLSRVPQGFCAKDQVKDLERESMMQWFDRYWWVPQLMVMLVLFVLGTIADDMMLGLSWVVWGVGVRTVFVFHVTWFVNSAAHTWGYQNFTQTGDHSRNLWWVALLSFGEGWHNNHHHNQRSAAHGMRWFEFDITYWTIRLMSLCRLASDVQEPHEVPR